MLKELALADVRQEIAVTRKVLDRLPEEGLDWRPHERSMTLGELATHLANLVGWQRAILEQDEFDFAAGSSRRETHTSRSAVLAEFDEQRAKLEATLESLDDEALRAEWVLRRGAHVIARLPRLNAYRSFGISHIIHHRAQLGVYLRLLDIPVPGVYGPSADEAAG